MSPEQFAQRSKAVLQTVANSVKGNGNGKFNASSGAMYGFAGAGVAGQMIYGFSYDMHQDWGLDMRRTVNGFCVLFAALVAWQGYASNKLDMLPLRLILVLICFVGTSQTLFDASRGRSVRSETASLMVPADVKISSVIPFAIDDLGLFGKKSSPRPWYRKRGKHLVSPHQVKVRLATIQSINAKYGWAQIEPDPKSGRF